ncbi:ATP-dependent endonuclease [Paenibacillus sp. V4I3]|uniref:ATP-dependent endonuclease n=1 Tax=Paenibacillus sp. V4I3 TaxID=3042305 RepID=UPI0027D91FEB|nr:ATP-dependent endonuclease [Paenibacillus sp. V4I3]
MCSIDGLALALGIELDRLNISILSVEGVGFHKYIELFDNLGIPWVIRTDNDYQLVSAKIQGNYYRLSGMQRTAIVIGTKGKESWLYSLYSGFDNYICTFSRDFLVALLVIIARI